MSRASLRHNGRNQLLLGWTVATLLLAASTSVQADEVLYWNEVLLTSVANSSMSPPVASRAMAMMHTAIYDAVNSIDRSHEAYAGQWKTAAGTSPEAAVAQAAHDVLVNLFPSKASSFDGTLTTRLGLIADGAGKSAGTDLGSKSAANIIALRANDNSGLSVPYTPGSNPGDWVPTPPGFASALLPNWPQVTPWSMTSGDQFRNSGPPALDSPAYAAALNEVKSLGSAGSVVRTADQTNIARFWADGAGTATPPGHWNRIAQDVAEQLGNSLAENARMFALLNIALADAAIVSWDNKFAYDFWRPVTAIQSADLDNNPATSADPTWTPLLVTPPFPTYTSGHSTFSGAASAVLASFFGTDQIAFTTSSQGFAVPDRSYSSFSQAADEAGISRIYGGIHYSFDNLDGLASGRSLGDFVFDTQLQSVPEPSTIALALTGGLTCLAALRWRKRGRPTMPR